MPNAMPPKTKSTRKRQTIRPLVPKNMPLTEKAAFARCIVTMQQLEKISKVFGTENEFHESQSLDDFQVAFDNYHNALWSWVWQLTPPDVIDKLNSAQSNLRTTGDEESQAIFTRIEAVGLEPIWRAEAQEQFGGLNCRHVVLQKDNPPEFEPLRLFCQLAEAKNKEFKCWPNPKSLLNLDLRHS